MPTMGADSAKEEGHTEHPVGGCPQTTGITPSPPASGTAGYSFETPVSPVRVDGQSGGVSSVGSEALHAYYQLGLERIVSDRGAGVLEFARTVEIIARRLPSPPGVIAEPRWRPGPLHDLARRRGYRVQHRDIVPLHVEQTAAATAGYPAVTTAVGDARDVDLDEASVDAVLLLGPLYHLPDRGDRVRALGEARRVVRPGGPVFIAAISRWAGRIHGVLADQLYRRVPAIIAELDHEERTGELRPLFPGSFNGFAHRPAQLRAEIRSAGLHLVDLVGVEGPGALLQDLPHRLDDPADAAVVIDTARALDASRNSSDSVLTCWPPLGVPTSNAPPDDHEPRMPPGMPIPPVIWVILSRTTGGSLRYASHRSDSARPVGRMVERCGVESTSFSARTGVTGATL